MVSILTLLVAVFGATKLFFSFLGWYSRDGDDRVYRDSLDQLWDKLQAESLADTIYAVLERLMRKANSLLSRRKLITIGSVVLGAMALNTLSFLAALEIRLGWMDNTYYEIGDMTEWFFMGSDARGISAADHLQTVSLLLQISLVLTVFDIASLSVTWLLLRHATKTRSITSIFSHIFVDIVIILAAIWWSIFPISIVAPLLLYTEPGARSWSTIMPLAEQYIRAFRHPFGDSQQLGFALILGATAALPSLIYLSLLFVATLAHLFPNRLRRATTVVVYQISVSDKPILTQVGTAVGSMAALLAILVKLASG